jgi:cytochrome P450 family 142 subfamily A polypeptide 1
VSSVIPTPTGRAKIGTLAQSIIDPQEQGRPDIDLTDRAFYAGDSRSVYKWMRVNEPVFRDRNGLAAAATYQAVTDA